MRKTLRTEEAKTVIERVASMQPPQESWPAKRKPDGDLPACAPSRRARTALQVARNRQAVDDAFVASYIGLLKLRPATNALSAAERLQAVLRKGQQNS